MKTVTKIIEISKSMMSESHRRQFAGEDYQAVAQDIADAHPGLSDDQFNLICESPEPDCDCGFCKTAPWEY